MKKNFDFVGHLKLFALIAAGVLVFGAVFNVIFGTKLDVAFKGGTLIRYSYEQKPDLDKLGDTAKKTLGNDATVAFDNVNDTDIVSVTLPGATGNAAADRIDQTVQAHSDAKRTFADDRQSIADSARGQYRTRERHFIADALAQRRIFFGLHGNENALRVLAAAKLVHGFGKNAVGVVGQKRPRANRKAKGLFFFFESRAAEKRPRPRRAFGQKRKSGVGGQKDLRLIDADERKLVARGGVAQGDERHAVQSAPCKTAVLFPKRTYAVGIQHDLFAEKRRQANDREIIKK